MHGSTEMQRTDKDISSEKSELFCKHEQQKMSVKRLAGIERAHTHASTLNCLIKRKATATHQNQSLTQS